MRTRLFQTVLSILIIPLVCVTVTSANKIKSVQLLKPQMEGGMPLMRALKDRASSRAFSAEKLPAQELSNILWAAFGVNRPESGKRTAPSAMNWQEIDIYVSTAEGLYLYDAEAHALELIMAKDIRGLTGGQEFVKDVPVNLIYVADYSRISEMTEERKAFYSAADTGFISQNVYLYCASEGLATVVRGLVDRTALGKAMELRPDQKVVFAQSVGYPEK